MVVSIQFFNDGLNAFRNRLFDPGRKFLAEGANISYLDGVDNDLFGHSYTQFVTKLKRSSKVYIVGRGNVPRVIESIRV